jgi:O-antigen/teichoic acid export membrane protein
MRSTVPGETAVAARTEDSIRKRYFSKLSANLVSSVVSFATQAVIPRGLGPAAYGNFSFLSAFFQQVVDFFDSGTSIAFYSKLSQRPHDRALLRFYWGFALVISLALILLTTAIVAARLENWLWPDQATRYILMGVGWGLLSWYAQIINKVVDAYGLTVPGEVLRIAQKVLGLGLIILMFWSGRFSLADFFLYQYFILIFLCVGWWSILRRHHHVLFPNARLLSGQLRQLGREFYDYSGPLITYTLIGMLVGILDRWLLQKFAGSTAQGFYGLSYQIGTLCFLFTSAMTPLFVREMSKAFGTRDLELMRSMFQRYVPLLFSVAAFLGVFFMVQASKVSLIFGGSRYAQASMAISLMSFYAIHRTYGQLSGSVFLATGQTRLYRNLGVGVMLLGLIASFFILAPARFGGMGLGATGLAVKMVIAQLVEVNAGLWFNARFLRLSYWKFLSHQFCIIAPFAGISWLAAKGIDMLISVPVIAFVGGGVVYALGCAALLLSFPSLLFLTRPEMQWQISSLMKRFKS